MRPRLRRALLALALAGTVACTQEIPLPVSPLPAEDEPDAAAPTRKRDATPAPTPDVEPEEEPDAAPIAADGGADTRVEPVSCRAPDHPVRQHHPKLIVALDRSTSMFRKAAGANQSPIQWVQDALRVLLGKYADVIYFGYEEFPISDKAPECGETCCASRVVQEPGPGTLAAIEQRWSCAGGPPWCQETFSESPSNEALGRIAEYYDNVIEDRPGPRYALLLTDHEPWCPGLTPGRACQRTIDQAASLKRGFPSVRTLVFGLSELVSDSLCLSEIAHHGGLARDPNKFPSHFVALEGVDFGKQLGEQLAAIARDACTFSLEQYVSNARTLSITLDGRAVPRDDLHGWAWVSDFRFRLNGKACDTLIASPAALVDVQICRR